MQDLVGCRIVVGDIIDQNQWAYALNDLFPDAQVSDRRLDPHHGYRAVHIIVRNGIQRYEIQLRTMLQDGWANLVEKVDDRLGSALKYGVGDSETKNKLIASSEGFAYVEALQQSFQGTLVEGRKSSAKMIICTYTADYDRALEEAYPEEQQRANEKAWEDARRRQNPDNFQKSRPTGGVSPRDLYIFSDEYQAAWDEAQEKARRFLRLVLWSSTRLAVGAEIQVGTDPSNRVTVLAPSPIQASVTAPTLDDLQGGHFFEISEPQNPANYILPESDFFLDRLQDVEVDIRNVAARLNIREFLE
jgi:hypothetical protein